MASKLTNHFLWSTVHVRITPFPLLFLLSPSLLLFFLPSFLYSFPSLPFSLSYSLSPLPLLPSLHFLSTGQNPLQPWCPSPETLWKLQVWLDTSPYLNLLARVGEGRQTTGSPEAISTHREKSKLPWLSKCNCTLIPCTVLTGISS